MKIKSFSSPRTLSFLPRIAPSLKPLSIASTINLPLPQEFLYSYESESRLRKKGKALLLISSAVNDGITTVLTIPISVLPVSTISVFEFDRALTTPSSFLVNLVFLVLPSNISFWSSNIFLICFSCLSESSSPSDSSEFSSEFSESLGVGALV